MNTLGHILRFTSFGESHGPAVGGVLDGYPSGIIVDFAAVEDALRRRRKAVAELPDGTVIPLPGGSPRAAAEKDEVEWLSGLYNGVTTGASIAFIIRNKEARETDYDSLKDVFRAGHADFTYQAKYGIRDHRGGGRASARETAARVVAGSLAQQLTSARGITIHAHLTAVGGTFDPMMFAKKIEEAMAEGDSVGGVVSCRISGVPVGMGEPVFGKVQSALAAAMLSIPACKGFEYGTGFAAAAMRGSESNKISGGIAGGITDGTDITFNCAFKPTPSIARDVPGRHDACVAARAVAVVEAMAALVMGDMILWSK